MNRPIVTVHHSLCNLPQPRMRTPRQGVGGSSVLFTPDDDTSRKVRRTEWPLGPRVATASALASALGSAAGPLPLASAAGPATSGPLCISLAMQCVVHGQRICIADS